MESPLFNNDLLTGLEPGEAEGGLRLRTRLRLREEPRFMESRLFETDLLTGREPGEGPSVASNPEGIAAQSPGLRGTSYPGIGCVF